MDEIWKALRDALLTDSTLTALLGGETEIYFDVHDGKLAFPCIVIDIRALNPVNQNGSFTGVWRPDLQINLYGIDRFVLDRINARLEDAWDIPRNRTALISSDNFQITSMRQLNGGHVGTVRSQQSTKPLRHFAGEWKLRVSKKPPPE